MKRIFIALAVILTVQMADAQVKSAEDAKKAVESAIVASENPKKAVKPATWIKLASAYENAYNSAVGSGWLNANKQDLVFIMGNVKPSSTENVTLAGQQYTKEVYGSMNYYFNPQGLLAAIEITKPVYEDALDQAVAAYLKAEETDLNGKKAKPSSEVQSGDLLTLSLGRHVLEVEILEIRPYAKKEQANAMYRLIKDTLTEVNEDA